MNRPWRLGGKQPDFQVNGVAVREVAPPQAVEPLHWVLLTSLPCSTWQQVRRVVRRYTMRWCVEEYHKALKSGTGAEDSQRERAYRIESLVAVLGIVAVRLLNTKWLALLAAQFGKPKGGWTHRTALVAVARVGGFLARRGDGLPGWQTIWRGWNRLMWLCHGLETLKPGRKRCGQ